MPKSLFEDWADRPTAPSVGRHDDRASVSQTQSTAPVPPEDDARVAALDALDIVGTGAESVFDGIVELVAQTLQVPIALVSLVTRDTQWFKANVGLEGVASTPRDVAFCSHTILGREVLVVNDSHEDARFSSNPLVTGDPNIRFYAGAPLVTTSGFALGTLCAIDRTPRTLTPAQITALQHLASVVSALIEARADRRALELANSTLERRERQFRAIAEHVPAGISYVDASHRIRYANRLEHDYLACADSLIGRPLTELSTGHHASVAAAAIDVAMGGDVGSYAYSVDRESGGRTFEVNYVPDVAKDGTVQGFYGLTYDVTERVRVAAAVAAREAQLNSLFLGMTEGLVVQTRDGRIIDANTAAEAVLGLNRDQLLGKRSVDSDWRAIREDGTPFPGTEHPAMVTLRTGRAVRNQIMGVQYADGEPRWISINSQPLPGPHSDDSPAVLCTFVDITEQRRAFEQIRALAQQLENVRESERREVAHSLHEGVAQQLYALRLKLKLFEGNSGIPPDIHTAFGELTAQLDASMADMRQIANDLHPSALDHLRLYSALQQHARYFETISGLKIEVKEAASFPKLNPVSALIFFRAAQEALANVARHANASRVDITLRADAEYVEMEITDDGVGMAPGADLKPGSLGLLGMRERFRAARGDLHIGTRGTRGTRVTGKLPFAEASD